MLVRNGDTNRRVEKTDVLDGNGTKIGERVLWKPLGDFEASITWNERARLFAIGSPSLQDALTFEKAKVWVEMPGCADGGSRPWPQANKSLDARLDSLLLN